MKAYYNEIDPYAAQWLRNLIDAGHIANGIVDERSIEDIMPSDLTGFTQCHFFAGVGAWSLALRRAGWPDDRQIWTGSCPCQPFSSAGAGAGIEDARHLWPSFAWLIEQCKPSVVTGEQVASKAAEPWVDTVHSDLEALGYAFGAVPFPSAGVGAPHIRDRLYWVGHLADTESFGCQGNWRTEAWESSGRASERGPVNGFWRDAEWLPCRDGKSRSVEPGTFPLVARPATGMGSVQSRLAKLYGRNKTGRLKGYGNAINSEAAAQFMGAYMETMLNADNDNRPVAKERTA